MLRLVPDRPVTTLWETLLPDEVQILPEDLAAIDRLLSDARLLEPFHSAWSDGARGAGRPTIAMAMYVRLMVIKQRSGWGYETLMREVSDSLHLRRFLSHRLWTVRRCDPAARGCGTRGTQAHPEHRCQGAEPISGGEQASAEAEPTLATTTGRRQGGRGAVHEGGRRSCAYEPAGGEATVARGETTSSASCRVHAARTPPYAGVPERGD